MRRENYLQREESSKYQFGKMEKHQNGNKISHWRRLTRIANDQLRKLRLNFSRCTNRDVAPLSPEIPVPLVQNPNIA